MDADTQRLYAEYYQWIRENGCILLPSTAADDMPTARMREALDEKMGRLVKAAP